MNTPQSPFTAIQALQEEQREGYAPERKSLAPTPRTNAATERINAKHFRGMIVAPIFAATLERELAEKDAAITDLNQRLIERQNSFTAQIVRIEDTWREKLLTERAEQVAQIVALREALQDTLAIARIKWGNLDPDATKVMDKAIAAISTPAPPVVPLEDVRPLLEAAKTLKAAKGRHNTGIAYERFLEATNQFLTKHPQP